MSNDERHYNIQNLNILFAISSVILLLAVVWMVVDDFSRPWKDYQKQFRTLDMEKTRVKFDAAEHSLEQQKEYQDLLSEIDQAQKDYDANCTVLPETQKKLESLRAENDLINQDLKFSKAKLDAARYRYESREVHEQPGAQAAQKEFDALFQRVNELTVASEDSNKNLHAQEKVIDDCAAQLKKLDRKKLDLSKKVNILQSKLEKIDPSQMDFTNQIADMVRDLPIIDLANPNYKVKQIVLKDLTDDVNFMQVPKVDRCITCHLGIDNPDYKDAIQPYTTHPNLDLYLSRNSAHPMEEFGCTTCHGGRGRGTDFTSAAHMPSSPEQAKEWEEKYGWHELHHWEKQMFPEPFVEAGCFKCHSKEASIKGADKLNLGLNIIEQAGCYSCHLIDRYKDWPRPGPNLAMIGSKVSRDWAFRWIRDPKEFRLHTWMPSFFNQSNNSGPLSKIRSDQEIRAMVAYLFKNSKPYELKSAPEGDRERGEELVASVGCMACHNITPGDGPRETTLDTLKRMHGPNLSNVGTKTTREWIYNWIKDPTSYHAKTKMPNLRLSDQEAADIATYLATQKYDAFNDIAIPGENQSVINDIVFNFLAKTETHKQAKSEMDAMSMEEKYEFAGQKLIRHYGCFSCHNIPGFEKDLPIGTELTEEGDKSIHKLDFGFVHIDHTKYAWFKQKLMEPRIFDQGRVRPQDEKLRMPNFHFTDEEAEAVVTALLGFVKESPKAKISPRTERNIAIENGQTIVRQMNCQACHTIQGEGGTIQTSVKDWLVKYDNRSEKEAEAIVKSFSPPNLIGEGKKVQAKWLYEFIHQPKTIRPWLKTRMPTFRFSNDELNALVKYFNALDKEPFPFEEKIDTSLSGDEYEAASKLFSSDYFDCAKCHIVGNKMPEGSPANWAPNFALAKERLKPDWIRQWIMDPQSLLPGTKMPNYFDPQAFDVSGPDDILDGDEHEQIRVLRNYLLTLSENQPRLMIPSAVTPASSAGPTPSSPITEERAPSAVGN